MVALCKDVWCSTAFLCQFFGFSRHVVAALAVISRSSGASFGRTIPMRHSQNVGNFRMVTNTVTHQKKQTTTTKKQLLTAATVYCNTNTNYHPDTKHCSPAYPNYVQTDLKPRKKTWVNTTQQTVHYLLNVNSQADNYPANDTQLDTQTQTDIPYPAHQDCPHRQVVKPAKSHQISLPRQQR
jgi:hypothetical protein